MRWGCLVGKRTYFQKYVVLPAEVFGAELPCNKLLSINLPSEVHNIISVHPSFNISTE